MPFPLSPRWIFAADTAGTGARDPDQTDAGSAETIFAIFLPRHSLFFAYHSLLEMVRRILSIERPPKEAHVSDVSPDRL
jgi:hypothetical protein